MLVNYDHLIVLLPRLPRLPRLDIYSETRTHTRFLVWFMPRAAILSILFLDLSRFHLDISFSVGGKTIGDTFMKNSVRLAEVWLDDYKQYFYFSRPEGKSPSHYDIIICFQLTIKYIAKKYDSGDISDRIQFKKQMKCKPFKWFLDNLMPNMFIPRFSEFTLYYYYQFIALCVVRT